MSPKRDKSSLSRHDYSPYPKRRRPLPPPLPSQDADVAASKPPPPSAVVITGLSTDCSVLDLKSRFEIYGAISRIRIALDGIGYITFRSKDSAEAAINAALDSFGITLDSKKVQVLWATDPLAQWREGVGSGGKNGSVSSSKLLRGEVPLSRHGKGNKLASGIVNPKNNGSRGGEGGGATVSDVPFKGREIVAYNDIL